jgi:hypothetical protein
MMLREWAMWGGGDFTHVYTDGSFRKEENWGELLLGKSRITAGGAIILSDGHSWFHKIYVDIDVEVEDAGQVELICLLIANEMARAQGCPSTLGSDCATALDIMRGTYSERFYNILAGWKIWEGSKLNKISAHPERFKKWEDWDSDDVGIYVADRVAGRFLGSHKTISARDWLRRISAMSKISIEEEDGTPFIGSVKRRASRETLRQYLLERDGYRELEGDFEEKWEGANLSMAQKLLMRNGGFEDRVTMVKLAAGKRWDVSRHNKARCLLCDEEFENQRHPLLQCIAIEVHNARTQWRKRIDDRISGERSSLRTLMEEYIRCVLCEPDGELAAVGTYTVRWVDKLDRLRELSATQAKEMKKLMGVTAQGARAVMRVYTRACCDKNRVHEDAKKINRGLERNQELRQLSMNDFTTAMSGMVSENTKKKKKEKERLPDGESGPPKGFFREMGGIIGLARWEK